ncbi:response regulator [Flectobacillus sp. BAB-3569]|uniref:response regulator n=1 Tax=Flectobacillus sp. BAB-3569 TaxID=1509483 RepID=UPI000BA2D838|nr:response regulator [Flectobacillus sp. BAB-3569]PAC27400.1 transcriptional regulator [Flectobacillus sp. BAB-3569]
MKKILLIEDSDDIRETTAEILELANYEVITAVNGKDGVEKAIQNRPDIVICDIMMPVLDGYGVLHIFNQNPDLQGIPFIFLTAKTERTDFRKGMEMGADDYLTKPFHEIELLNAIESRLKKVEQLLQGAGKVAHEHLEELYSEANKYRDLTDLSSDRKVSTLKKKQIIYSEGDEPIKFYFLKSGKIKTYKTNRDGKEFVTGLYNEGDFFGHIAIIENTDYQETAEALEDSQIIGIPRGDFMELLSKNQQVANKFIKLLANNIADKETYLLGMAYNSLRKRVADGLLLLQKKYKAEESTRFTMKISRDDLASIVGTATESLIRTLSEFKADKLIEISGSEITIIDEKKLSNLRN